MNGPVASTLVLLADLATCAPGAKVRFLGCVDSYIPNSATLQLKHDHPHSAAPQLALVDIAHVLESVKRHEIDVGSWVNVIGYVERRADKGTGAVQVQAVALWDAGNVNLEAYQNAVEKRKHVG